MKTSYLKFLRIVITVCYYGLIVALAVETAALVYNYFVPQSALQLSMHIPLQLGKSASFTENDLIGVVNSPSYASLYISLSDSASMRPNSLLYLIMGLSTVFGLSLIIAGLYQLRKVVQTFGSLAVFSAANMFRIRLLGVVLIASEFIRPLYWWIVRADVLALLKDHNITNAYEETSIGVSNLTFAGLLIIGLAEVFRSGYQLKQESELTI